MRNHCIDQFEEQQQQVLYYSVVGIRYTEKVYRLEPLGKRLFCCLVPFLFVKWALLVNVRKITLQAIWMGQNFLLQRSGKLIQYVLSGTDIKKKPVKIGKIELIFALERGSILLWKRITVLKKKKKRKYTFQRSKCQNHNLNLKSVI